jgi:phospholipid/cholesterol/gamma-HCH transport system substrate-binding protein
MARRAQGMSPFKAGLIAIGVIVVITYLAFAKQIPFTSHPYKLKAVFANAANLRPASTVRIAGVDVGKVTTISAYKDANGDPTGAALVTMEIDKNGLPIHRDAVVKIRPKLFLEGNFFVDIQPGSPSGADLHSGSTIPVTQTAAPVQIDQVLSSLQADTRTSLQKLLTGYGTALNGKPQPGEDADQVKEVQGLTAGQALNKSLDYSPEALRGTALVNQGFLGVDLHDLSKLVSGTQKVAAALNTNESTLQDFITNFNRTVQAFANQQDNLRQSIALLGPVLTKANSTFVALDASFAPTRAWARDILPGVRETASTIDASFPWIAQTRALVSPGELQGLVNDLRPATKNLAAVTDESIKLVPQLNLLNLCATNVLLPTGDLPIHDGFLATGVPNYKEAWQAVVGLAGESQNFDGNGQYTRFQAGGGAEPVFTGSSPSGVLFGNATAKPLGTQPKRPSSPPPKKTNVECFKQQLPNLDNAPIGPGP